MIDIDGFIIREYRRGKSCRQIAKLTGLSRGTIFKRLKRNNEPTRPAIKFHGQCIECGKPSGRNERCDFHRKIREADLNRWRMREVNRIPEKRWRVSD